MVKACGSRMRVGAGQLVVVLLSLVASLAPAGATLADDFYGVGEIDTYNNTAWNSTDYQMIHVSAVPPAVDCVADGSQQCPFPTIEDAVSLAKTTTCVLGVNASDCFHATVVVVATGTYNVSSFSVVRQQISFLGDHVLLQPQRPTAELFYFFSAGSVFLSGFSLHANTVSFVGVESSNLTVANGSFSGEDIQLVFARNCVELILASITMLSSSFTLPVASVNDCNHVTIEDCFFEMSIQDFPFIIGGADHTRFLNVTIANTFLRQPLFQIKGFDYLVVSDMSVVSCVGYSIIDAESFENWISAVLIVDSIIEDSNTQISLSSVGPVLVSNFTINNTSYTTGAFSVYRAGDTVLQDITVMVSGPLSIDAEMDMTMVLKYCTSLAIHGMTVANGSFRNSFVSDYIEADNVNFHGSEGVFLLEADEIYLSKFQANASSTLLTFIADYASMAHCELAMANFSRLSIKAKSQGQEIVATNCTFASLTIACALPLFAQHCVFARSPLSFTTSAYFEHVIFLDPPREEVAFPILAVAANVTMKHCHVIGGHHLDSALSAPFISISNPYHIQSMPKLIVDSCTFEGIQGSSIEARFSIVDVTNSTFAHVEAQYGSVLYCDACAASFFNVTIDSCRAETDGGAFYFTSAGAATLSDVKASNCSCVNGSGAFIDVGGATVLNMTSCSFTRGTALTAGAISMHGLSHLVAEDVHISQCRSLASGGAIVMIDYSVAEFVDSSVSQCTARSYGGAASCGGYAEMVLHNVNITENRTPMVGGAIYLQDFSKCNLTLCLVANNNAGSNVGGIAFAVGSVGSISDTLFTNNTAGSSGGSMGCFQNATAVLTNVAMIHNEAESGGAVWTEDTASFSGTDVRLILNSVLSVGGALLVSGGSSFDCTDCVLDGNRAGGLGGAMFVDKVAVAHFQASNFTGNFGSSGGAVAILANSQSLFEDCKFAENTAQRKGGAFVASVAGSTSEILLDSCDLLANSAFSGGAFYATIATSVTFTGGTVKDNIADCCGGAFVFEEHTVFSLDGVEIANNTVQDKGAAFFLTKLVQGVVRGSHITQNRALQGGGGGIFILESAVAFIECDISSNIAVAGGGVLLQLSSPILGSKTEFSSCNFTDNVSYGLGGGIAVVGGSDVALSNTTAPYATPVFEVLHESLSDLYQQGLLDEDAYAELYHQQLLEEEAAAANADQAYTYGEHDNEWTFTDSRIVGNVAHMAGGGIYVGSQYLERVKFGPNRTEIHDNFAGEMGGGIFIQQGHSSAWLFNGDFQNNTAVYGGYNVAWVIANPDTSTAFCHNCTYGGSINSTMGYNDARGFATLPAAVALQKDCPEVVALNDDKFSVSTCIIDAFQTEVVGEMLKEHEFQVLLDVTSVQNCMLAYDNSTVLSTVDNSTGLAYFDVGLKGSNGTNCSLSFSEAQFLIKSAACSVFMEGCVGDDMDVVQGVPYDHCALAETESSPGNHVTGSLVLALMGLILMLVVAVIGWVMWILKRRKKARLKAYYANLEIPDRDLNRISLAELLEDPKIPVIQWEDLEILERIGTGASGIVSHGIWQRPMTAEEMGDMHTGDIQHSDPVVMDVDVAVKELLMPIDELNSQTLKQFIYEIQLMSALKHPSVVEFLGVAYDGEKSRLYLVTELMDNGSLTEVLHKKGKNLTDVVRTKMAKDAAKGMVYLHSQNIIHRDLKTANLLVNSSWQCKISDFGISTVKSRTMTMTCIGTPLYMAPEVLQQSRYSEKADVYSFGIVLVELFTNRSAYSEHKGINDAQLLYRIVAEHMRPRLDELPGAIQELVADCLTEDPAMRPSFAEILTRLKRMYRRL